jgi:hypothetical protein
MLSLQTDMSIPKDIDAVWIEISKYGNTVFRNRYDVGPSGVKIPATLAVEADPGKSPPVTIRVISQQGTTTRTLREVVTTVPPDRTAMLRVPIEWLCDGSGEQIPNTTPPQFKNTCPARQTCQSGTCTTSTVDSSKLPTFKHADVFGGGNGDGTGKCFDTLGCFATPVPLQVDTTTCTADVSQLVGGSVGSGAGGAPTKLNVALELPAGGDGICDSNKCLVPLDEQTVWTVSNTTVTLPKAVCDRLQSGAAQAVVATLPIAYVVCVEDGFDFSTFPLRPRSVALRAVARRRRVQRRARLNLCSLRKCRGDSSTCDTCMQTLCCNEWEACMNDNLCTSADAAAITAKTNTLLSCARSTEGGARRSVPCFDGF